MKLITLFILTFTTFSWLTGHAQQQTETVSLQRDTAGLYRSPIRVSSYKPVQNAADQYKNVQIAYKNVSKKKVSRIWFYWQGLNDKNELVENGEGDITANYKPGRSGVVTLAILKANVSKVKIAYPYKVMFEDGSIWTL